MNENHLFLKDGSKTNLQESISILFFIIKKTPELGIILIVSYLEIKGK